MIPALSSQPPPLGPSVNGAGAGGSTWLRRLPAAADRTDLLLGALCGLLAGLVYGLTRVRELLPGDGGEFQFLGIYGGHAHVTGYAVYLTLLQLFAQVPFGDPILRATLFSSLMGGVAVAIVYVVGRAVSGWRVAGIALALAWGGAATLWSQSVQAEVYTAAATFTTTICWCVVRWLDDRKAWRLALAGTLGAASLGVHGSVGLFAPGIGLALLAAKIDGRGIAAALGGVGAGVALFLAAFWFVDHGPRRQDVFDNVFLPWAAAYGTTAAELAKPAVRLEFLMQAKQWQKSMFASPVRAVPRAGLVYLRTLAREFTWAWIALALVGIGLMARRHRPLGTLVVVGLLFHHLYSFNYEIMDIYVFFIPAFFYLGLAAAFGAGALLDRVRARGRRPLFGAFAALALAAGATGAPSPWEKIALIRSREATTLINDLPSHAELTRQRREIERLVAALPPSALVAMDWMTLYRFIYIARQQGRDDLRFIEARPWSIENLPLPAYRERLRELADGGPLVLGMPEMKLNRLGYRGHRLGQVGKDVFWRVD